MLVSAFPLNLDKLVSNFCALQRKSGGCSAHCVPLEWYIMFN